MALSSPELLTAEHDLSPFTCGKPALDLWLKARALSNQQKGFTVVMVVHDSGPRRRLLRTCAYRYCAHGNAALYPHRPTAKIPNYWLGDGIAAKLWNSPLQ